MVKKTKEDFCKKYPEYKSLRKSNPTKFNALYQQWYETNLLINNLFKWKF